ncbi:MAG: hypothetical protein JWQ20_345 [Conexibacter sp.]|jgi:diadenosine tetraphosphate (Ap4A) HIT family hydrolase|nr:hypothetical protein [Conexibacter sp.]
MACGICDVVAAPSPDALVYEDDLFLGYQLAEVPGWVTVASKVHVDGPGALDDAQADGFGRVARSVTRALQAATGADRVHMVYLGENSRHFHAGFFPRRPDQPALLGNEGLLAELGSAADPDRAAEVRRAVRDALGAL